MQMERVVITGMGTVNALAKNTAAFARALQEGACGIGPLTVFDTTGYRTCNGAEVKHFNPREMIPPSFSLKRMSRADNLAFAATIEVLFSFIVSFRSSPSPPTTAEAPMTAFGCM